MLLVNNTTKIKVPGKDLEKLAAAFAKYFKVPDQEISLALIGDAKMRRLNLEYRGQDRATDILSFAEVNEIIINLPQIKRQAKEFGHSFRFELDFVLTHGLLHLLGYTDEREVDRKKMIKLGEDFLSDIWYNRRVKYED
ncbi:MAG TPA: rRNA maturation RNase YbeY [bacterium]|nr:rRNA maturation RNase YbeY [bacterium]HPT29800.1 rRNA maturation RNase YbeY [bacterium]